MLDRAAAPHDIPANALDTCLSVAGRAIALCLLGWTVYAVTAGVGLALAVSLFPLG